MVRRFGKMVSKKTSKIRNKFLSFCEILIEKQQDV